MNGTCHTSADSPTNPNQPCVLPFNFDGKLTNECLFDKKEGKRWCATKVDNFQEIIEGNWGYCSTSCSGIVQSKTGATFSDKNRSWKGKSLVLLQHTFHLDSSWMMLVRNLIAVHTV